MEIHAGNIEYKMPEAMAQMYLKQHKGKVSSPNEYLCKIVNEEFGIKGNCVRVITF